MKGAMHQLRNNVFLEVLVPWFSLSDYQRVLDTSKKIKWLERNTMFAFALEYPEKRIESGDGFNVKVSLNAPVSLALEKLLSSGKDFIGVVDKFGRFQGIITRDVLVNKLLLSLSHTKSAVDAKALH